MRSSSSIRSFARFLGIGLAALLVSTGCATAEGGGEEAATLEEMQTELSECREMRNQSEDKIANLRDKIAEMNERVDEAQSLAEERRMLYEDLEGDLADLLEAGQAELTFRRGLLLVRMPNRVLFESGRYTISQQGKSALQEVADALEGLEDRHIFVSGHTDNVPVSDKAVTFDDNWELSTKRALSALQILEGAGLEPIHLAATGFSKYDPIASNESESGRQKNRRVELIVMPDMEGVLGEVDQEVSDREPSDDDAKQKQAETKSASAE